MASTALNNFERVKYTLQLAFETRNHPTSPFVPLYISETGVGKTTMVRDAMKELIAEGKLKSAKGDPYTDYEVFYINLASKTATDFDGFPVTHHDENGKAVVELVPLKELEKLLVTDKPTLFFLDEWNRFKDMGILQVLFEILRKRYNGKQMHDLVFFAAAENPLDSEDNATYFVMEKDAALEDRVCPVHLHKEFASFRDYIQAQTQYDTFIKNALLDLLADKVQYFNMFSNRTLELVLNMVNTAKNLGEQLDQDANIYGILADKTTTSFVQELFDQINDLNVSIVEILVKGKLDTRKLTELQKKPFKVLTLALTATDYIIGHIPELRKKYANNDNAAMKDPLIINYTKFIDFISKNAGEIEQALITAASDSNNSDKNAKALLYKILFTRNGGDTITKMLYMYGFGNEAAEYKGK